MGHYSVFLFLGPNFILIGQLLEKAHSSFQCLLHKSNIDIVLTNLRRFVKLHPLVWSHFCRGCRAICGRSYFKWRHGCLTSKRRGSKGRNRPTIYFDWRPNGGLGAEIAIFLQ